MNMDDEWHTKKCRDCAFRVQDVDPENIGFKGVSFCRSGPPHLLFVSMISNTTVDTRAIGSQYPLVAENTLACSLFESNKGVVKKNIIKQMTMPNPGPSDQKLS
jgi:hypothetical protein